MSRALSCRMMGRAALWWLAASAVCLVACQKDPCQINPGSRTCKCFKEPSASECVDAMGVAAFNHVRHFNSEHQHLRKCTACHEVNPDAGFSTLRPGRDDHKPCKGCHSRFFEESSGGADTAERRTALRFCETCHARGSGGSVGDLNPYPKPHRERRALLITEFSHARHLGRGLACEVCHEVKDASTSEASMPRHQICSACHTNNPSVSMGDCTGCHGTSPQEIRAMGYANNGIRFSHGSHIQGRQGELKCERCHEAMAQSNSAKDHKLPGMAACVLCHTNADLVSEQSLIENNCGLCHTGKVDPARLPDDHR